MSAAVYGLCVGGTAGCIIPTPLDQARGETNKAPVFVIEAIQPPFGPRSLGRDDPLQLSFAATDPNAGDNLEVRLFERASNAELIYFNLSVPLTKQPNLEPNADNSNNLWKGNVDTHLCEGRTTGTHYIYAVVGDRPFDGDKAQTIGGLTDTNHWELTCQ